MRLGHCEQSQKWKCHPKTTQDSKWLPVLQAGVSQSINPKHRSCRGGDAVTFQNICHVTCSRRPSRASSRLHFHDRLLLGYRYIVFSRPNPLKLRRRARHPARVAPRIPDRRDGVGALSGALRRRRALETVSARLRVCAGVRSVKEFIVCSPPVIILVPINLLASLEPVAIWKHCSVYKLGKDQHSGALTSHTNLETIRARQSG